MESSELFKRSLKVAPGGVHSPVRSFKSVGGNPIFFTRAEGAHLQSVEGVSYIDFCQSFGPLILGHCDPEIKEVAEKALIDGWSYGACEPYSLALAEWITGEIPWIEKIRFVSSGTEAVMSALRVARGVTGRSRVLKFAGCYHGHVDSLLVKSGSGLAGSSAADSAGISDAVAKETLVADLDSEESVENIFRLHGPEIAALIIEPLPANFGLLLQRKEFLQKICSLAKANGSLVIFDEVISGFRTAMGGMAELLSIRPDLCTYGKVIGGGFPVGAYGGSAKWMDLVAPSGPVYQAGTLSANPLCMRVGLATLEKVKRLNVHAELERRSAAFCTALAELFLENENRMQSKIAVSRQGSIFWIHPDVGHPIRNLSQIPSSAASDFARIFQACLREGIYLAPSGYEVGFIGYAHTADILNATLDKLRKVLRTL